MGYTTTFEGRFDLDKPLTVPQYNRMIEFSETRHDGENDVGVGIRCDRVPSEDGKGIMRSGAEKFYDYVERLNYIIVHFLQPRGITISGQVKYSGEEISDSGILKIVDGKCVQVKAKFEGDRVCCPHCEGKFYLEQSL